MTILLPKTILPDLTVVRNLKILHIGIFAYFLGLDTNTTLAVNIPDESRLGDSKDHYNLTPSSSVSHTGERDYFSEENTTTSYVSSSNALPTLSSNMSQDSFQSDHSSHDTSHIDSGMNNRQANLIGQIFQNPIDDTGSGLDSLYKHIGSRVQ
jgi:hypothetical protein